MFSSLYLLLLFLPGINMEMTPSAFNEDFLLLYFAWAGVRFKWWLYDNSKEHKMLDRNFHFLQNLNDSGKSWNDAYPSFSVCS